jgi:hypothetical protein
MGSTPGYLNLCDLLASHGIIAATIDVSFSQRGNFGENDGRAIVHLEHLKQFHIAKRGEDGLADSDCVKIHYLTLGRRGYTAHRRPPHWKRAK